MTLRITPDMSLSVQQALRELDERIDRLTRGSLDMHGRRVARAGDAIMDDDLVTLRQLREGVSAQSAPTYSPLPDEKWERIGIAGTDKEWLRPRVVDNRVLVGAPNINGIAAFGILTAVSDGSNKTVMLEHYSDDAEGSQVYGFKGRGTRESPTATLSADRLVRLVGNGLTDAGLAGAGGAKIELVATENWTATAQGARIVFSVTKNGTTTFINALRILDSGDVEVCRDAFGGLATLGRATEELTLSTVGATTDTAANLLPVGSLILAVNTRITTALTGPTTSIDVGDATTANRFADNIAITLNATNVGIRHQDTSLNAATVGPAQVAAAPVRITANGGNPTAGKVRISVCYVQFTAPTS